MATISFTCPHCEKVLRSTQRPPAGRKVKCPACNEGFVPELDNDEAAGIQEEPRLKSKAKAVDDDVDAEEVDVDEVDDDEKPRKKKKNNRDDDDEDDGGARKKKKGKKKAGANKMLIYGGIALVGIGGLFICVLLGVGAFVWPGFLRSNNSALLAFVAPDANMVMHADLKQTRTKMEPLEKMFREQGIGKNPGQPENNAMIDLMKNADKLVVSSNTAKSKDSATTVIQAPAAEIEKFKKSPGMGAPLTIGGHANVYKQAGGGGILPRFVAFPAADIVVFADQPEAEFIRILDRGKKGVQQNAAIDLGKSASGSLVWVAVIFDADMRKNMKQSLQQFGKASKKMEAAVPAVDGCKGVVISFEATNKQDLKIAASLTCKDAGDAAKMKDGLDDGFNQLRGFLAIMQNAGGMMPGQAEFPKGIIQDLNSTAFQVQGSNASATLTITSQSLQELGRFGEKKGGMGFFP